MRTALVGYTGFVGSNLAKSFGFTDLYNTSNIEEIAGKDYDLVVTAGNRADSHRINNHPAEDRAEVEDLIGNLRSAQINKLVLVSTVCVFPQGGSPDEDTELDPSFLTPYGQNRLFQEQVLTREFDTLAVRLPQLYGDGLKKGVVYDLANDYRVEFIRPDGLFQHYDVRRLWTDVSKAIDLGIPALNVATPPLRNDELAREVFGRDIADQVLPTPESQFSQMYTRNMTTKYASLFEAQGPYLCSKSESISCLKEFVNDVLGEGAEKKETR